MFYFIPRQGIISKKPIKSKYYVFRLRDEHLAFVKKKVKTANKTRLGYIYDSSFYTWLNNHNTKWDQKIDSEGELMRIRTAYRRLALDTVSYFTPYAKELKSLGISTVFRYLNYGKSYRDTPDPSDDWFKSLSKQEIEELLGLSLRIGLVQRGIGRRNSGGRDAGLSVGEAAVYNAKGLNIPEGATIFCDCEWSDPPSKDKQISYIESWAEVVRGSGYIAGLYVSPDLALDSKELYMLSNIQAYWKSASYVPTVDTRGFQVIQSLEYFYKQSTKEMIPWSNDCYKYKGLRLDLDMVCVDGKAVTGHTGTLQVIAA